MESLYQYLLFGAVAVGAAYIFATRSSTRRPRRRAHASDNSDDESSDSSYEDSSGEENTQVNLFKSLRAKAMKPANLPSDRLNIEKTLEDAFVAKSIFQTAACVDLTRLVRRLTVTDAQSGAPLVSPAALEDATDCARVAAIINTVARRLETNEDNRKQVDKACSELAKQDARGVPEVSIRKLFAELGESSATAAIFKCIHQGVLVPMVTFLHASTRVVTKDVKDESGWRVRIELSGDGRGARVTHARAAASVSDAIAAEAFRVDYEISFALGSLGHGDNEWSVPRVSVRFDCEQAKSPQLAREVRRALQVFSDFNE